MTQTQQFDADVLAIEPEGTVPFTLFGKDYVCQRTPIVDKNQMVEAGFEPGFDFTISVRLSQFSQTERAPANNDTITIADVDYRIVGSTPDQFGIVNTYAVKQN